MSNEINDLIAEARRAQNAVYLATEKSVADDLARIIAGLADALEARQHSGDDREALRNILLDHMRNIDVAHMADAVLAAGFSRAAVPDAAIRELTESIRLTVEYVGNDMLPAIEGWDWYDALVKYAPEVAQAFVDKPIHFPKQTDAEAERDAALAAIERVTRAKLEVDSVHQFHGNDCLCGFSSARSRSRTEHITGALLAALDGAPEPEWEYGLGNRKSPRDAGIPYLDEAHVRWLASALEETPTFGPQLVRRRKAGPWLPVEGESNE